MKTEEQYLLDCLHLVFKGWTIETTIENKDRDYILTLISPEGKDKGWTIQAFGETRLEAHRALLIDGIEFLVKGYNKDKEKLQSTIP